jgi:flagellar biosynthetic protein FlhB
LFLRIGCRTGVANTEMPEAGDKSEEPTAKRLTEAHEKGQFARSPDVSVTFVLAAAFGTLIFTLREETYRIVEISVSILSHLGSYAINPDSIAEWAGIGMATMMRLVLPMGVACTVAALVAGGVQSRFQFTPKVVDLNFDRINPVSGFSRVFSAQGWIKLCIDSTKLGVVGMVIWGAVKEILADPMFYTPVPITRLGGFIQDSATALLGRFILVFGGLAAAHYFYQLRKTNSDLKMTKQEVRDESRNSDGDPKIKNAMRALARRLLQKQMLSAVPNADVVITNPTHFAVALKYERGTDKAPVVVAKGSDMFAKRIKAIAAIHEVPMIENKPVARMLFKYAKVGKPIPMELYQAVAEILAFVYKTHRYYFHMLKIRRSENASSAAVASSPANE